MNINTLSTFFTFVFVKDPTKLLVDYNLHFMSYVTLWHDALKSIVSIYIDSVILNIQCQETG